MKKNVLIVIISTLLACLIAEALYLSFTPRVENKNYSEQIAFKLSDKLMLETETNQTISEEFNEVEESYISNDYENESNEYTYQDSIYMSYYEGEDSILTREKGVNNYNGRIETWYSSEINRHYLTDSFILCYDGVYRDIDGYVVVACSDIPYGGTVDTSLGIGKVYDNGCADNITDIYTNW